MHFKKKSIYKKHHILPKLDRDHLMTYGFVFLFTVIMFGISFTDSKLYRASILTANEQKILVDTAHAALDVPYLLGADVPPGKPPYYDCSSLMVEVFKEVNINLPRISRDQALVGKTVAFEDVKIGDLLFFDTADANRVTHVGMVTNFDNDKTPIMVNANSIDGKVKEERVSGKYWRNTYVIAKRVNSLTKHKKQTSIEKMPEDTRDPMPPTEMDDPRVQESIKENIKNNEEPHANSIIKASNVIEFTDVPDNYPFKEAIEKLAKQNILKGSGNNKFDPYRALTRAELLKVGLKANKTSQVGKKVNLYDIKGHWVEKYVKTAVANGYVKGYPDNTFKPDKPVSRGEGAKIILEIANITNKLDSPKKFFDIDSNSWINKYASIIKQENLLPLNGNNFEPHKSLSRGEAANIIHKASLIR